MHGRHAIYIFLIVLCIITYPPALAEEVSSISSNNKPSYYWSDEEKQAYAAMTRSFDLYEVLLADVREYEGYRIAIHGESRKNAMDYLTAGFEADLAANIIEAYLLWVPEVQKLTVVPCDGIPTLNDNDMVMVTCSHPDKDTIIFERSYEDCYKQGDSYLFSVFLHRSSQGFRIEQISLEEVARIDL